MREQHITVPLLEGVRLPAEALGLERTAIIGGIECRVLLPVRGPFQALLAGPSTPAGHPEQDPGWPESLDWGDSGRSTATIRVVGLIPAGTRIPPGDEHLAFDRAVAQWRHLLRDWLAVAAEGPTDFPESYGGATIWGASEYDGEEIPHEQPYQSGYRHGPQRLSAWSWTHALGHASAGQELPLARVLMASAIRASATANWRVAIIDAATTVEVALIAGLTAWLSPEASPRVIKELTDATLMLGRRLDLAKNLGMPLPAKIKEDLVTPRNKVVHQGTDITGTQVKAAITAAWAMVREYDPLPACCHDSTSPHGAPDAG
jgi:hypothetical protein